MQLVVTTDGTIFADDNDNVVVTSEFVQLRHCTAFSGGMKCVCLFEKLDDKEKESKDMVWHDFKQCNAIGVLSNRVNLPTFNVIAIISIDSDRARSIW